MRNVSIQALWGLTTVAEQLGEIAVGTLKLSHIYNYVDSVNMESKLNTCAVFLICIDCIDMHTIKSITLHTDLCRWC